MQDELHKLRIDKAHKARRDERPVWPWAVGVLVVLLLVGGVWMWQGRTAAAAVETIRVRVPESGAAPLDDVRLSATGYVMAAHKIELASKVVGRVAWVEAATRPSRGRTRAV